MIDTFGPRTHFSAAIYVTITRAAVTVRGTDAAEKLGVGVVLASGGIDADVTRGYSLFTDQSVPLFVNGQRQSGSYVEFDEGSPVLARPLRIKLGGGNDVVRVNTGAEFSRLTIDTGAGNDYVYVLGVRADEIGVDTGDGDDRIDLALEESFPDGRGDLSPISRGVAIYPGSGRDRVRVSDPITYDLPYPTAVIDGKLLVNDVQGHTDLTLEGLRVARQTMIETANATDRITLDRCRFIRPAAFLTHGGLDTLTAINGTGFRSTVTVDLGGQDDDRVTGIPGL